MWSYLFLWLMGTVLFELGLGKLDNNPSARIQNSMAFKNNFFETRIPNYRMITKLNDIPNGHVRPCINGIAAGIYPCDKIDLMSHVSIQMLGGKYRATASDIWGWTDSTTNMEYAIIAISSGFSIVNVTDPVNPVVLFVVPAPAGVKKTFWRDVKVYQNVAYVVADTVKSYGIQIFDLTRVRGFSSPPEHPNITTSDHQYNKFDASHNIFINEDSGMAYTVGGDACNKGINILDLREDKFNPRHVACWTNDSYVHDIQCVNYDGPDLKHTGKEICFCYDVTHIAIIDVTDKDNIITLSKSRYPNAYYTHQGWLTSDKRFILVDDELDEVYSFSHTKTTTFIFDVTDLENPVYKGKYTAPSSSTDHNLYIKGEYVYQSNYASGLRINSLAELYKNGTELEAVAFFDVFPDSELAGFVGAWSSYIYFPSGNLIVSCIDHGLFVVRPNNELSL